MSLVFPRDGSHPMVDTLLRTRVPRWRELNRAIDERDDMYSYALELFDRDADVALTNYFQNGLEQFELLEHISSWRERPCRRLLDFASGYGRLTRFLVHDRSAESLVASDILPGAMEFQAAEFGIETILSASDPAQFVVEGTFDLIFVASLFTHLPPATFTSWLRRLTALLSHDGLLVFSVHDETLAPGRIDGIRFATNSESSVLSGEEYGSTWVSEGYVRERLREIDPQLHCARLPRAISEWQDVYVVSPAAMTAVRPLVRPRGFVERCEIGSSGVRFSGWAVVGDLPPERIELRVEDEVVAVTRDFGARADLQTSLGASAEQAEWSCEIPRDAIRSFRFQVVTLSAFSSEGRERILYLGTIDGASAALAREHLRARTQQLHRQEYETSLLEDRIAAMRQSRFWRARSRWFRVKRALRLTDEE